MNKKQFSFSAICIILLHALVVYLICNVTDHIPLYGTFLVYLIPLVVIMDCLICKYYRYIIDCLKSN